MPVMKHILITTIAAVLLMGCGNPDGALLKATQEGNIKAVKQAIADGTDVNARNSMGRTPLHYAASRGHKEVVELLIAAGAEDVNAKTKGGLTSLDFAILRKHPETADLLRKHGGKTGEELKAEGK